MFKRELLVDPTARATLGIVRRLSLPLKIRTSRFVENRTFRYSREAFSRKRNNFILVSRFLSFAKNRSEYEIYPFPARDLDGGCRNRAWIVQ